MMALAKALVPLQSLIIDGRELYREQHQGRIKKLSETMVAAHGGASFQRAWKQLWDQLGEDGQEYFEEEARNNVDIARYLFCTLQRSIAYIFY
jgi:hypothetical protein